MDGEELATHSRSATPSHVNIVTRKENRKKTAEQKKEYNYRQRQNKQKRLKTAETIVPALSAGVRVAEEQNTALKAALQQRELRIELLAQHLEVKKGECAPAKKAQREAEQAVRDTESALLLSEARSLALKGEFATASDKISTLVNEVTQLRLALTVANASAASSAVLCSQALGVATEIASLADEVIRAQPADDTSSSLSSLSFRADSPRSFERTPDDRAFSPSPPLGFLDP